MKAEDQHQEEKLRRLLRLKRFEQPQEGFAEEFLEKFQRRQRSELMRRSSLSLFRERLTEWLHGLRRPSVIIGAGAVYASIMLALWLLPRSIPQKGTTVVLGSTVVTAPQVNYQPGVGAHTISTQTQPQTQPPTTDPNQPGRKRRTVLQGQDKQEIIGPEAKAREEEEEKLRDF